MFQTPEQTTIFSGIKNTEIKQQLMKYMITTERGSTHGSQLLLLSDQHDDFFIFGLTAGNDIDPKPFFNPIEWNEGDDTFMVVDLRASTRWDRANFEAKVSNVPLFRRDIIRTIMQSLWSGNGANEILRLGNFQVKLFANWINDTISRRFALDGQQSLTLTILAAYYYLCLFTDSHKVDNHRTALVINRSLNISMSYINEQLDKVEPYSDITSFLASLPEALVTERLAGLNIDVFISLLAGSWFGANNSLLVGTALEYPPNFVTLAYLGLTDKGSRLAGLSKLALRFERDNNTKEFVKMVSDVLHAEVTIDF